MLLRNGQGDAVLDLDPAQRQLAGARPVDRLVEDGDQDDGTMLCDEILSRKSYEDKVRVMGADIASANYQQEPIDIKERQHRG